MNDKNDMIDRKGIIAWFAQNHVAANLLMFMIMVVAFGAAAIDTHLVDLQFFHT